MLNRDRLDTLSIGWSKGNADAHADNDLLVATRKFHHLGHARFGFFVKIFLTEK
jgi:hypothetical protein